MLGQKTDDPPVTEGIDTSLTVDMHSIKAGGGVFMTTGDDSALERHLASLASKSNSEEELRRQSDQESIQPHQSQMVSLPSKSSNLDEEAKQQSDQETKAQP